MMQDKQYIPINSKIRFGKSVLMGRRITVDGVLNRMFINKIIEGFHEVDANKIKACLAYCADREHKIQVVS
jgi:uncharacterized protein (DUF433 family)